MRIKNNQFAWNWTSSWKINIHNQRFSEEFCWFFPYWSDHFQPLLRWESTYVWKDLNTEKQSIYVQEWEHKARKWHTAALLLANQTSKVTYFSNLLPIFQLLKSPFLFPFVMGKYIRMPRLKNWKARYLS